VLAVRQLNTISYMKHPAWCRVKRDLIDIKDGGAPQRMLA
jgi:hypothetical protein